MLNGITTVVHEISTDVVEYHYWDVISVGYHLRIGALALLFYDYFLTLDDEVELFWKRPRAIATYLFLWTRYGGMVLLICTLSLVTSLPDRSAACRGWFIIDTCLGSINTWVVEAILFLRLYALYNCSRIIALSAALLFVVQMLSVTAIGMYALPIVWSSVEPDVLGGITYCEMGNRRPLRLTWVYWACFAFFEAFVLCLTIRKGNTLHRHQKMLSFRLTNLVSTLYWDSIYYSILIEVFYILNIILNLFNELNYDILSGPVFTLSVIMGGRMMINVRKTICEDKYRQNPSTPSQITLHVVGMDGTHELPPPPWALIYI